MWSQKLFLLSVLLLGSCRTSPAPQDASERQQQSSSSSSQVSQVLKAAINTPFKLGRPMNEFASQLYDELVRSEQGNIVLSPFSIHTTLSMVYYGSPKESETHAEMAGLLGMQTSDDAVYPYNFLRLLAFYDHVRKEFSTDVQFANKIYTDDTFVTKDDYANFLDIFYLTTAEQVDFSNPRRSAAIINQFVNRKTNGLIRQLLRTDDVDALTRMVLINAIYFKANWKYLFQKSHTASQPFYVNEGESFPYPHTMFQRGTFGVASVHELDAQVLELPYEDDNFRMLILLPNRNIGDLDRRLLNFDLSQLDDRLVQGTTVVQLPRFEAEFRTRMEETLATMGVTTLFDQLRANLSDITDEPNVAVQKIIHMAKIKVNEEGSEAAAATAAAIGTRTANGGVEREFIVDRPFVFVIQDRLHNIPLFMGRIVDPSGQRKLRQRQQVQQESLQQQQQPQPQGKREVVPFQLDVNTAQKVSIRPSSSRPEASADEKPEEKVAAAAAPSPPRAAAAVVASPVTDGHGASGSGDDGAIETSGDESEPDCDELGYRDVSGEHSVSFPCPGQDTPNIRAHEQEQRRIREGRQADFLSHLS